MNLKVNGMQGLVIFLFIVAMFGSMHLLAASMPESKFSQIWFGLGF